MKYFLDTEFIEGFNKPWFEKKRHFIDLISIGVVSEDGRTYYAISSQYSYHNADEWVKENVILPAYKSVVHGDQRNLYTVENFHKWHGKNNVTIAEEIKSFIECEGMAKCKVGEDEWQVIKKGDAKYTYLYPLEFYGYYADYDWVLFCSLFGRMIDLPKGFPMYCKDLKQMLDEKVSDFKKTVKYFDTERGMQFGDNFEELSFSDRVKEKEIDLSKYDLKYKLDFLKKYHSQYPKQKDEHNALADAKWNKELYEFIKSLT